jgi:hypothetical protein
MMSLNNGTADREADSHAFILRGVKRFEKPVRDLRFEAHPNIGHVEAHPVLVIWLSSN